MIDMLNAFADLGKHLKKCKKCKKKYTYAFELLEEIKNHYDPPVELTDFQEGFVEGFKKN